MWQSGCSAGMYAPTPTKTFHASCSTRVPFYYTLRTLFLLYLSLPQTAGSSYLYKAHVQPFFSAHEREIDSALVHLKSYAYNYVQRLIRQAWGQVAASMGQAPAGQNQPSALDEGGITGDAAMNTGASPSLQDPLSGPTSLMQTLWGSYGPAVIAAGTGLLRQAQSTAQTSAQAMDTPPAGPSRMQSSQSVIDRRKQLEAELAALAADPTLQGYDLSATGHSRASSSSSLRGRGGQFEEVEVPSDMESEGLMSPGSDRPAQNRRTSWFGWGGPESKGYERVKTD